MQHWQRAPDRREGEVGSGSESESENGESVDRAAGRVESVVVGEVAVVAAVVAVVEVVVVGIDFVVGAGAGLEFAAAAAVAVAVAVVAAVAAVALAAASGFPGTGFQPQTNEMAGSQIEPRSALYCVTAAKGVATGVT